MTFLDWSYAEEDPADVKEAEREAEIAYDLYIAPIEDMAQKAEKYGHWRC